MTWKAGIVPPAAAASAAISLGRRLIMAQPDADSRELDEGEVVGGVLLVSGRNRPVVFELVEEPFDEVLCRYM